MSLTSWSCNFFCISEDKVTGEAIASDLKKMAVANPQTALPYHMRQSRACR